MALKINKEIKISEKQLNQMITDVIEKEIGQKVKSLRYCTSTRGDYDRGTAVEYVETLYVELH